jgi:hypothetical protein
MSFDPERDAAEHPDESMQQAALRLVREARAMLDAGQSYRLASRVQDPLDGALYYLEQTAREPERAEPADAVTGWACGKCGHRKGQHYGDGERCLIIGCDCKKYESPFATRAGA